MDIINGFIHIVNGIYEFLWGDLIAIPLPGGGTVGISLLVLLTDPGRDLFYSSASFSADPSVSGYDPRSDRKE